MKIHLVYPQWPKLKHQPDFNLPPHGPVCFAAALPRDTEIIFTDENVEPLEMRDDVDLVAVSCMLAWSVTYSSRSLSRAPCLIA